jgi:N-acyl amino acid synthase of PEP-CTERM/exosortase system
MSKDVLDHGSGAEGHPALELHPSAVELITRCVDHDPELLAQTYRLRYQVYCIERPFLRAADYPDGLETDQFDRYSKHLGTFDHEGRLVGTARLVFPSILGLPLFHHCSVFSGETELHAAGNRVAEVSRLSVSRRGRRREMRGQERRRWPRADNLYARADAVGFSLYRELYQASKRAGLTHWLVATEASLQRTVADYGFPFRSIGPEIDYFGPVSPYLMSLSLFDRIILSRTKPRLDGFLDGLDEPYRPRLPEEWPDVNPGGSANSDVGDDEHR